MLYFDHSASTPPHEDVIRTMAEVMAQHYANPASIHRSGSEASKLMKRARELMGELFQVGSEEWVFTSGGTESNNLAIKGAAFAYRSRGNHLITTQIEHASVYEAFRQLEQLGYRVTYLPVDSHGLVSVDDLKAAICDETILVSIMHVNNEVGSVQPLAEIGDVLKQYPRTLFHVDGVQSIGKLPIRLKEWHIDLFSGSAHKLRGPKGNGWLYVREGITLDPLFAGGGQEGGLRSGTPNLPGIVASVKAARLAMAEQTVRRERMGRLRSLLIQSISNIPELKIINGGLDAHRDDNIAPHIVHVCYPGMKPEVIVHLLEKHGIIVSTKSACSSKEDRPSRVLLAMGTGHEAAKSGIRISLGDEHTENDIRLLSQRLAMVVKKLKPLEGRG
ncbi:cysteine desulfurase family protein [Paenibacillus abyssi]|uniref:Aminotransferase V n=1 Tax=Paenibacillus abyssi TaxID=1340531 RepID=A0A917D696_9BACL|nr:cysteine desulfurase family protein [Paenibacillus abyssi]GGG10481.1 aminotransferase V [Paenibacillus abyssi]